ncbi:MAG: peptidoglycan editing factor PgeF [Proteobacteria bacterium]|nr:peptidoglycan editing factor PgeF [Pseudomonadota bacterium]HQR03212.1 peptidoglycan editing factor PgeF [Rhodocyclaceae bacterium]
MSALILPDWPAPARVAAVATTRRGGCSRPPFADLNLGDHVGDDPAAVAANRRHLHQLLPELPAEPLWLRQVHGNHCVHAEAITADTQADACVTRHPAQVCAILSADCLPILLCDETGTVVAAAHAGWRGLAAGVIESTVAAMERPGANLMAWLGPAIGPAAFEVGEDVHDAFTRGDSAARAAFRPRNGGVGGKWWCDLYQLARLRLKRLGVERISGGEHCTHGNPDLFFSHRRDRQTGRMASLIWLRPL